MGEQTAQSKDAVNWNELAMEARAGKYHEK